VVVVVELPGSVVVVVVVVVVVELELVLLVVVVVVWHGSVVEVVDPVVDVLVVDDDRVVADPLVVVGLRLVDARVVAPAAAVPVVPAAATGPLGAPAPTVTPPAYTRAQPRIAST
jgi:hypothetical protein